MKNTGQRYLEWNNALINYFFKKENNYKEIILYADKALINDIGEQNNLGNYQDFLENILIDKGSRTAVYDQVTFGAKRPIELNKALQKAIFEFPNTLKKVKTKKHKIIYFNYIIFYITIIVGDDGSSFYNCLNEVIRKYLSEKHITSLNGLGDLFEDIERWSLQNKSGIFRSRRIGKLAYKGLLNYQVVLRPDERQEFELTLYTFGVYIDDNTIYPDFLNKILPHVSNNKLRKKLIDGLENPVYSEWFLNRALQFDHDAFSTSDTGKSIIKQRKGVLAFNINPTYHLELLSDTILNQNDEPIGFHVGKSGLNPFGFYESPLVVAGNLMFEAKRYTTNNKTLELKTLPIRGVNFFQKSGNNFIQRLSPDTDHECLIVVEKTDNLWVKWSQNSENIDGFIQVNSDILDTIFGNGFAIYHTKNIKKSIYGNVDSIYTISNYSEGFRIKKLGGLKVSKNLYLDIGLPHFEVDLPDLTTLVNIDVTVLVNGIEDNGIKISAVDNKYYLMVNSEMKTDESSLIVVKFELNSEEKSFDFSITGTGLEFIPDNQLFKYDKWGDNSLDCDSFFQGSNLNGCEQINLNNNKHELKGLNSDAKFDQFSLIYLLVGISVSCNGKYLRYNDILKCIDTAVVYLRSIRISTVEDDYSKYQLINNLVALGYLNYKMNESNEKEFQINPFGIRKIEKSFNMLSQVYQITGVYSRRLLTSLKRFCEEQKILIKYKPLNENNSNSLQSVMLPDIIYLELQNKVHLLKSFLIEEFNHELIIEDTYHLGDSLLGFIGSLSDFEGEHLNNQINLSNQNLLLKTDEQPPRIVETEMNYKRFGKYYSKKFLEKKEGEYYEINHPYWTNLFVQNKRKLSIIFTNRTFGQTEHNYSEEIILPTRLILPELVYLTFCNLNHGIPIVKKVFWKNAPSDSMLSKHTYSHFDHYYISDKTNRRENIARILTGFKDLENNPQLKYCRKYQQKYMLYFVECSILSDFKSAILIKDDSFRIVGIYVNKILYISSTLTQMHDSESSSLNINGSLPEKLSKVQTNDLTENQLLSKLLDGKFDQFEFNKSNKVLNAHIIKEEKIEIRELA